MGCLYALLGFDFVAWAGLAILFADTLHTQGGVHAPYYFYLPIKVATVVLCAGLLIPLSARVLWFRPVVGPVGALVGLAAAVALPVFLMFSTGGI
jgi:hypothetical protein